MPLAYIKDNYKIQLPIIAENKRKLKIKINKQDMNFRKMKFGFSNNPFIFWSKEIATNK